MIEKSPTLLVAVRKSGSVVVFDTMVTEGMKRTACAVIASYPVAHTISSASTAPSLSSTSQLYRTVNMSHRQPTEYNSNEVSDDVTHDTVQSLKSDQTERKSIFLTPHPIGPVSCVTTSDTSFKLYSVGCLCDILTVR